jgi:hypothetical protein
VLGWDAFDVCDLAEFWQRRPDDLDVVRADNETMVLPTAGELMDEAFRARVESMTYTLLAGWRVARLRSTLRGAGRPGARGSI